MGSGGACTCEYRLRPLGTSGGDDEFCGGHLLEYRETAALDLAVFPRKTLPPLQLPIELPDATGCASGVLFPQFGHDSIGINQFGVRTVDFIAASLNLCQP